MHENRLHPIGEWLDRVQHSGCVNAQIEGLPFGYGEDDGPLDLIGITVVAASHAADHGQGDACAAIFDKVH
jgi:hypothetical protein